MSDQPTLFTPAPSYEAIPTDAGVPIPPGTYADHAAIAAHCEACRRCRLAEQRTRVAVSRGNPNAPLMLIGEGPGQQEDLQGKPFVGPAGQLLDKILESVKLDPHSDVFIANVVKCRPPGNRVPEPDEVAACRGYLLEQVRLVKPKLLLLVGGTAAKGVMGEQRGITKIRGQWTEWQGIPTMPIFHPSYLLRNPVRDKGGPKWLMWQDIQEVRRRLDEILG
jgi:DNA polymerase